MRLAVFATVAEVRPGLRALLPDRCRTAFQMGGVGMPLVMSKLILENFRCFQGRHEFPLRPLTLLVGENSTGKTSFLGAVRIASGLLRPEVGTDFNEEPFNLGAFDEIATFVGGRGGRARNFAIGFECASLPQFYGRRRRPPAFKLVATFAPRGGQPEATTFELHHGPMTIKAWQEQKRRRGYVEIQEQPSKGPITCEVSLGRFSGTSGRPWLFGLAMHGQQALPQDLRRKVQGALFGAFAAARPPAFAFAPIRTRPERTYDPRTDIPRPEGNHVPMVLDHALRESPRRWKKLAESLRDYGESSGLFRLITVRRLGRKAGDPFRILVKLGGAERNLVDVGYGVSQVLPFLVDIVRAQRGQMFLLQQPEVHLHPRAQAGLGSFLAAVAAQEKKQFLVETHSDALIDRVRLDIRDRKSGLSPQDALILFFERGKGDIVSVHQVKVDAQGNLVGAPPSYRSFFLGEEARLLGVS
jgi:hypothetical protein